MCEGYKRKRSLLLSFRMNANSQLQGCARSLGWILNRFVHRLYLPTLASAGQMFDSYDTERFSAHIVDLLRTCLTGKDFEAEQLLGMCYHVQD
jgi:hypothetical protein